MVGTVGQEHRPILLLQRGTTRNNLAPAERRRHYSSYQITGLFKTLFTVVDANQLDSLPIVHSLAVGTVLVVS